ncbi:MAG: hypothetical protein AAFY26_14750 [Cyanobacteria bacterium J06638_22]
MKHAMLHRCPQLLRYTLFSTTALLSLLALTMQASRSSTTQPQASGWRRIFEGWLSQEPPVDPRNGGSRPADGEGVCWVAPFSMPTTAVVWSDRPTFTWQSPEGQVTQLELQPSDDRHAPLTYPISADNQILDTPVPTYQLTLDRALEPGVTYEWRMYRPLPSQPELEERIPRFVRVEVMAAEERDGIATELTQLEETHMEQGIEGEDATFQRAAFFGERGLLAEMWQTLLSQPEPSEDLEGAIADTLTSLCTPPTEE